VADFLSVTLDPKSYLATIVPQSSIYDGFNLLAGDFRDLYYFSNRSSRMEAVPPGVHGLSNHLLDTAWPKVTRGIDQLRDLLQNDKAIDPTQVMPLLCDQHQPMDDQLPETGVGLERERMLAPIFISSSYYGTRCSSVLLIGTDGRVTFHEQIWQTARTKPTPAAHHSIRFTLPPFDT
jgi:uncharacterized protein with NRDE domain